MFKCTECEKIYDIKPDYCDDCGNDVFEEIVETLSAPKKEEIKRKEAIKEPENMVESDSPAPKKAIERPKRDIDYLSVSFLAICILISLYIIFFAWNPKAEDEVDQKPQNKEVNQNINIPSSVEAFWNNELPKTQPKPVIKPPILKTDAQPKVDEVRPLKSEQIKPQPVVIKTPEIKKPLQPAQSVQKQASTTVSKPKVQTQQQKPVQIAKKPVQTTSAPKQVQSAQTTKTPQALQQKPAQKTQPQTSTQPVWQAIQQPQVQPKPAQTVDTSAQKKEFANYKINLRNAIGRKIDFANVIGDGSCTVSFKIDSNGKLINRAFNKQSSNTILNDAVYSAVMATPSYNPPPSGYKGETLYLKISFYNGNFQISLN